ncbi:MFS transporter [Gammaproteobacteria bacterium]|jgi:PAT family beta-lactamase induction signal transducer AmpG|nr:MFS transporter [Gammaproteobacteria bacterium]
MYKFNKMFVMFSFGFASGLPYMIIISTSTAWLRDVDVDLAYIGFFSWVTFMYAFKFLWAPLVDRFSIPFLKKYGHRKSWIVLMQFVIFINLLVLSSTDPKNDFIFFSLIAFFIALAGSIQDIAIDAFRIEYADIGDQGSLAATYQFGWRLAIILATSFALIFADINGWSLTYKIMAASMVIGLLGLIASKEEKNIHLGKLSFSKSITEPFIDFLSRFGFFTAAMLLLIIATYRLTDIVMGPMATPFYIDMGFTLTEIGSVVKIVALLASIFGISMGALLLKRIGIYQSLMIGAFLVMFTNVCFSYVAISEKSITSLSMIVAMDSIAAGIVGTVNIAFLTSLVSKKYTGFQYALLTGFMAGPGFVLKGLSGLWVNYLQGIYGDDYGWMGFYVTTSLLTMPVILFLYSNRHFLIKHENSI